MGFPWWPNGKESIHQSRKGRFNSWVRKIPWRRKWQSTPVFLPGKSHEQRNLAGVESIGRKESDTAYRLNNNKAETINIVAYFLQDCLRKNVWIILNIELFYLFFTIRRGNISLFTKSLFLIYKLWRLYCISHLILQMCVTSSYMEFFL